MILRNHSSGGSKYTWRTFPSDISPPSPRIKCILSFSVVMQRFRGAMTATLCIIVLNGLVV